MNMITARERTSSFTDEVWICISRIGSGNYPNFPQLEVSNGEISLSLSLKKKMQTLRQSLNVYISASRGISFTGLVAEPIYF